MKFVKQLIACGVALMVTALVADLQAQTAKQSKAKVRKVQGEVQYKANAAANWAPLKQGTVLNPGAIVETAKGSTVDLWLVDIGSVVRVTESTQLGLDKLNYSKTEDELVVETELNLKAGTILGNVRKLAAASRYDVKIPNGVCGIRGTEYKVSANGVVHVVSGTVRVSYTPPGGAPVVRDVNAGQTFYPPVGNQEAQVTSIAPTDAVWIEFKDMGITIVTPEGVTLMVTPVIDPTRESLVPIVHPTTLANPETYDGGSYTPPYHTPGKPE
jgi:hypothetical protein